jgi:hypothetical protein
VCWCRIEGKINKLIRKKGEREWGHQREEVKDTYMQGIAQSPN